MRLPLAIMVALLLTGSAVAGPFTSLGGTHPARTPIPPARAAEVVAAGSEGAVRQRIEAWLAAQGFGPTEAAKVVPGQISYVRLGDRESFRDVADCHGPAIGEPKVWIETLLVDLRPEAQGVRVAPHGQFQVILSGLVSGKPFKMSCQSRGVLEAALSQAAKG